jgi:two-component system, chemotaxis family, response regulator PixG
VSQTIREHKYVNITFKDFILRIGEIKKTGFSGDFLIKIEGLPIWKFHFLSGKSIDISGGIDPASRWQRNLAVACLNLPLDRFVKSSKPDEIFLNSNLLAQQYAVEEVIFDIIQFSQHRRDRLAYQLVSIDSSLINVNPNLPVLDIEQILTAAIQTWREWASVGLTAYAPSLSPLVQAADRDSLPIESPDIAKIVASFDGSRSLRSLAICHQQNLLDFTKPLLPLLLLGGISTILPQAPKSDRDNVRLEPTHPIDNDNLATKNRPSIACIDDSIYVYKSLEQILTASGYRCFGIQDPLKIITTLIKNKPDLIFLDILMPITNGYEVCKQIRKTPSLKNIPIVILTAKEGSIDRIHAKFVGANGFISKPIRAESILKMLDKHLVKSELH